MTTNFDWLEKAWTAWMPRAGRQKVSASFNARNDAANFISDDVSYYLHREGELWTLDTSNDRGSTFPAIATFSTFQIAERYLTWEWASITCIALRLPFPDTALRKNGYSGDVTVTPTDNQWRNKTACRDGYVIVGQPDSTIFSYFMRKSVDDIHQTYGQGIF